MTPEAHEGRSLGPFLFLLASLVGLAAFFLLRPAFSPGPYYQARSPGTTYAYSHVILIAFVPYALALRACRRGARPPLRLLLAGAAVLYVALIAAPAHQSQDVYQYLLYGKMSVQGLNPYVVPPSATADPWLAYTLWDDTQSVYGPLWTSLTAIIVRMSGGSLVVGFLAIKAVTAGFALGATAILARVGRKATGGLRSDPEFMVLAFAYNPLVLLSVGLGAHADIAVAAAIAGAVLAWHPGSRPARWWTVTLLLTAGALVKPYVALVLLAWLVALLRQRGLRSATTHAASALALAGVAFAPYWAGVRTFSGMLEVGRLSSASLVGSVQRLLAGDPTRAQAGVGSLGDLLYVATLLALVAAAAAILASRRAAAEPWWSGALLLAVYMLVTPWYLYWHLTGLVALASVVANEAITRGVLTFSATSFVVTGGMSLAGRWSSIGLALQTALRYGLPLGVALAAHHEVHASVVGSAKLVLEALRDEMRRLGSHQLAPPVIAGLALVFAGPLYGGEVVGGVYGFAVGAGLLTYLALRQLKLRRG